MLHYIWFYTVSAPYGSSLWHTKVKILPYFNAAARYNKKKTPGKIWLNRATMFWIFYIWSPALTISYRTCPHAPRFYIPWISGAITISAKTTPSFIFSFSFCLTPVFFPKAIWKLPTNCIYARKAYRITAKNSKIFSKGIMKPFSYWTEKPCSPL